MSVGVIVNGVGAIGKRVAHAVSLQKDLELVGVSDVAATSILTTMLRGPIKGTKLFASTPESLKVLQDSHLDVSGTLEDALGSGEAEVVVDATPAGIEEKNKALYEKYGVRQVFEGGAKAGIAEASFNANANYEESLDKKSARVVSCNTTSLARTLFQVRQNHGLENVTAALVRRAVDPWNAKHGPINAIVPALPIPSHHGPDLKTVLHDVDVETLAVKVPTTLAHVHMLRAQLRDKNTSTEQLHDTFAQAPRVINLKAGEGYTDTAAIIEHFRDMLRPRYDMYECVVWDDSISVINGVAYWVHAVHSEAIVIPDNVDAIRAVTGAERDALKSIKRTDKSLGVLGTP